jgi:uncharacterized membrane protein
VLADISLFTISLWIHICAAVIGLGATFALSVGFPIALQMDPRHLPYVHRLSKVVGMWFANPALIVLLVTGIYQTSHLDYSFGKPWISGAFLIIIILGGLQGAYFIPTDRKLEKQAAQELAGGATELSADYQRQARREGALGAVAGVLVVIALFLMATKVGGV